MTDSLLSKWALDKGKHDFHLRGRPSALCAMLNPFPNDKILDSSKLGRYADDNFNFAENDRKFLKRVENSVGKGEIAHYEQFLLFP